MPQKCCTFQQLFYTFLVDKAMLGFKWNGRGRGLDFNVVPLKEVRNPDVCASGYLILFCLLNLLKYMIFHPKS
jgi:hypothetical protein